MIMPPAAVQRRYLGKGAVHPVNTRMEGEQGKSAVRGKGRKLNHVEDFITFYGSAGGREVIDAFENIGNLTFTLKWDGRVAVHFGRDGSGRFGLGTKAMWDRRKMPVSAGQLHSLFMANGSEPWRAPLAESLGSLFQHLNESVPAKFRGFVMADVLFMPNQPPKRVGDSLEFTPNRVTYSVQENSDLGRAMAGRRFGMAIHSLHAAWGDDSSSPVDAKAAQSLGGGQVAVFPPIRPSSPPRIGERHVADLKRIVERYGKKFDWLIQPRGGLNDFSAVIYRYTNHLAKSRTTDRTSAGDFFEWLKAESGFGNAKINKIAEIHNADQAALGALLSTVKGVAGMKDRVIGQIDGTQRTIRERTGDKDGGEGYVVADRMMKFVPRHRWVPEDRRRAS